MENEPFLDLLWRTLFRWRLHPRQVTGDKTYGTADIVAALEGAGIHAYVALPQPQSGKRIYPKEAFTYDAERDVYRCPAHAILTRQQVAVQPANHPLPSRPRDLQCLSPQDAMHDERPRSVAAALVCRGDP